MKAKSKQLLFAVSGTILLGGGVWMSHLQSQDGSNSDMLLANIEAMAKVEESTGYQTVEKITEEHPGHSVTIFCKCSGDGTLICC